MTAQPTKPTGAPKRAFNVPEFCAVYGIGKDVVCEAIREEKLVARKLGARTIIAAEDGDKLIASLPRLQLPPRPTEGAAPDTRGRRDRPVAQQHPAERCADGSKPQNRNWSPNGLSPMAAMLGDGDADRNYQHD